MAVTIINAATLVILSGENRFGNIIPNVVTIAYDNRHEKT